MTSEPSTGPIRTTLIDIANCIGCRACQVACKQWNERDGEETELGVCPRINIYGPLSPRLPTVWVYRWVPLLSSPRQQ
jgi:Fe-S-cluster-containing dehydrogenase component